MVWGRLDGAGRGSDCQISITLGFLAIVSSPLAILGMRIMLSIDLIRENLKRSEDIVLARVEDMREHCVVFPNPKGGCHTLWILGHLAYIECLVIHSFMLGEPNPLADWKEVFDTDKISGDEEHFPPFDRVLDECRRVRASTVSLLDSLDEGDLDKSSEEIPNAEDKKGVELLFGTFRRCFQYASDHWLMHRGQLADARCAAGLERMWY